MIKSLTNFWKLRFSLLFLFSLLLYTYIYKIWKQTFTGTFISVTISPHSIGENSITQTKTNKNTYCPPVEYNWMEWEGLERRRIEGDFQFLFRLLLYDELWGHVCILKKYKQKIYCRPVHHQENNFKIVISVMIHRRTDTTTVKWSTYSSCCCAHWTWTWSNDSLKR